MAFMINKIIDLKGILFLMLLTVTSQATNLDCNGKAFHCVNSTHFMICVDLGRGTSTTIDDIVIPCPLPTVCRRINTFECEFLPSVQSSTVAATELVTTESEVITFAPLPITSVPFEEYFNTVSTTTQSQTELPPEVTISSVNTRGLDKTNSLTPEIVITEKSISTNLNTTLDTVEALNSNSSNINASYINSNDTLSLIVNINNGNFANNTARLTVTYPEVTESINLNSEFENLDNSTSKDLTGSGNEQLRNTENVLTTQLQPTSENITETITISDVTVVPVKVISNVVANTTTEPTLIIVPDIASSLQEVASIINNNSTQFNTHTQGINQINELQSVPNAPSNFSNISEVSVNETLIEVTSAVPEQTVQTEPDSSKKNHGDTVNATNLDNFPILPDTTTPLELTQDTNIGNTYPSVAVIKNVTNNFSDVQIAQKSTTNIITTQQTTLNTELSTSGTEIIPITTTNRPTGNTEFILTKDFFKPLINVTETAFTNTEVQVNTTSTDIISTITEPTVTNEQAFTLKLNELTNLSISENSLITTDTAFTVEQLQTDITSTSKSVHRTNKESASIINTSLNGEPTASIDQVYVTESLKRNNLEISPPTELPLTDINYVGVTENLNYQEPYQTTTMSTHTSNVSLSETKHINEQKDIKNGSISEKATTMDITTTTDAIVTTENTTNSLLDTNKIKNYFDSINIVTHQNNTNLDKVKDGNTESFTTHITVPEFVTESQFTSINNTKSEIFDSDTTAVKNTTEGLLQIEKQKTSENVTSQTKEQNSVTEVETTIFFNNLVRLTNTTTATANVDFTTENNINNSEKYAKSNIYDMNNRVGNTTAQLIQNEKVLSTNDVDNKVSTQLYKPDSKSTTETSTTNVLVNKPMTTISDRLFLEEKNIIGDVIESYELPKLNISIESVNKSQIESTTLSFVTIVFKSAEIESSIQRNAKNQIHNDTKAVSRDDSSDVRIDGQTQIVTERSPTASRNVTDSSYINSLASVKQHSDKVISTDKYEVTDKISEIAKSSTPTATVDQNQILTSENITTLPQIDTIPIDTSTSLPSTVMEITEAAYALPDYTVTEINKSIYDDTNINYTRDLTETHTQIVTINNSNRLDKEIGKTTVTSDANVNKTFGNTQELLSEQLVTAKRNNNDTIKEQSIVSTHTYSEMPLSTDPISEIARSTTESIYMENSINIRVATDKNHAYLSSLNDVFINNPTTTENNLLDNKFTSLDLIETHSDQITISEVITPSGVTTQYFKMLHKIGTNVQSATDIPPRANNAQITKETSMPISLEEVKNIYDSNLPTLTNQSTIDKESVLPRPRSKTDLILQSSTYENSVINVSTDSSIITDTHLIENSGKSVLNKNKSMSDGLSTEIKHLENKVFGPSNSMTLNQPAVTFSTHIPTDINTKPINELNILGGILTAPIDIPLRVDTNINSDYIINENSANEKSSHNSVIYAEKQTNPMEKTLLNSPTLAADKQESLVSSTQTNLDQIDIAIDNERIPTSWDSLIPNKNTKTTSPINAIVESSRDLMAEMKPNSDLSPGLTTLNVNRENTHLIDDPKAPTINLKSLGLAIPVISSTLPTNYEKNSDRLLAQTNNNSVSVNASVNEFVTKSFEKPLSEIVNASHTLVNHDMDIELSANNGTLLITLPETMNSDSTTTKLFLTSITVPVDSNTSLKQSGETVSRVNTNALNSTSIQPKKVVNTSTTTELYLRQTDPPRNSAKSMQTSQIPSFTKNGSVINTKYETNNIHNQVKLAKTTGNFDENIKPTTEPVRIDLVTADVSQILVDNINTKADDKHLTTTMLRQPAEALQREANTNIEINFTEMIKSPDITKPLTIQMTEPAVQNIKNIEDSAKTTSFVLPPLSPDSGLPAEVVTTADVLINSKTASGKTHSGIISFITQPPHESNDKKEKPETIHFETQERQEHPINIELASLQTTGTHIPDGPVTENGNKVQRDISTREELSIKAENINYKTASNNSEHLPTKISTDNNIHKSINTTVSGYERKTPTHELIVNNSASESYTLNNKSKDQNTNIPQAHNKSVISNDQSSVSRNKSTAAGDMQTTGFPPLESTTGKTELTKFPCNQKKRGRYADELDCRKFYICLGNKSSHVIEGTCPLNTVFSEINKQCTKNLSHCIRNNQFRCITEGRFSDFLNDNIYYICVRNSPSHFIRFKLQCLNGYHLNKASVRCDLNNESTSTSETKSASEQSSSSIKQETTEKPEKKFKCKKAGIFPDPSNCKKYYECTEVDSSYRQKKKKCDSGEIFHKDKKKCVDADSYEC